MSEILYVCETCSEECDAAGRHQEEAQFETLNLALDHILKTGHSVAPQTFGE